MTPSELKLSTKEKILYVSLELFAKQGYEAVSMKMISAQVGIRESSIYKHYTGKQAILDAIIQKCTEQMDSIMLELNVPTISDSATLSRYANMQIEDIAKLCTSMCQKQIQNHVVSNFRKLLTIEQYRNESLKYLLNQLFVERPLEYIEKVFSYLLDAHLLHGESAKTMALQFFAPFYLLQYQMGDNPTELHDLLMKHAINFIKEHYKEDDGL